MRRLKEEVVTRMMVTECGIVCAKARKYIEIFYKELIPSLEEKEMIVSTELACWYSR